jgi:hypothetical protein
VLLQYRLPFGRKDVPLADALAAIELTREHADAWNVDPQRCMPSQHFYRGRIPFDFL